MSMQRTRARSLVFGAGTLYRRIPQTMRRMPGGRSGGTGGGGQSSAGVEALVGLSNFSAANYLATAAGGGEAGVASGFGNVTVFRLKNLGSAPVTLRSTLLTSGTNGGWQQYINSANAVSGAYWRGTLLTGGSYQLTQSDVGRVIVVITRITAVPGQIKTHVNKFSAADMAIDTYSFGTPAPSALGAYQTGAQPSTNVEILAALDFRGVPSQAQMDALFDAIRTRGDLPDTMDGATITHRWSLRDELRGTVVVDGQTAPAQLTDTVTRAPVDALARQGSPVVRVIDPAIDGRRTLGAMGFSASSYLVSAANKGIRGNAAGFVVAGAQRWDRLASQTQYIMCCTNTGAGNGWYVYLTSSNGLAAVIAPGTQSPTYQLTASDLGRPRMWLLHFTGAALRFYVDGVQVGADTPCSFAPATSAQDFRLGNLISPDVPFVSGALFAAMGGNVNPSLATIQQAFADFDRTGKLVPFAGIEHNYDLTLDTLASGVDAVPAVVLDRVGSDHLTRVGFGVQTSGGSFIGIGPYVLNVCYGKTQVGGGIQGSPTMHVVVDVWLTKIPTAVEAIVSCQWNGGWTIVATAAGKLAVELGSVGTIEMHTLTPGDLNRTLRVVLNFRDAAGADLWVDGVLRGNWAGRNYITETAAAMTVGQRFAGTGAFTSGYVKLVQGGSAASLTPAEIATDPTQPPPVIAGKTQKQYLFELDAASSGGAVPGRCIERISGNDDLTMAGNGLVLAQRTERLWSYEDKPIANGADLTNYSVAGGFAGDPAGFLIELWFMVLAQTAGTRVFAGKRGTMVGADPSAFRGWQAGTSGVNNLMTFACGNATATASSPSATIAAADIGKMLCFTGVYDAPAQKVRGYLKRAESGTGTALATGYLASTDPFTLGRRSDTAAATDVRIFGFRAGRFVPTLAEVQSAYDAVVANERMSATDYGGRPLECMYRFPDGVTPSTLQDLIGTAHLSVSGSPVVSGQYARAWAI